MEAARFEDPPTVLHDLRRPLGFQNSSTLRASFRAGTNRLLEARASHAQKETTKLRGALLLILRGESVPSLSSVARQLNLSVSHLAERYPDLCRTIRSRYLRCRKQRTHEREQLLNEEVCQIAMRHHSRGQLPTEPYHKLTWHGLPQATGSAAGHQERLASPGTALTSKRTSRPQPPLSVGVFLLYTPVVPPSRRRGFARLEYIRTMFEVRSRKASPAVLRTGSPPRELSE